MDCLRAISASCIVSLCRIRFLTFGWSSQAQFAYGESSYFTARGVTPWGCSLAYQARAFGAFGYRLAWFALGNAVFAPDDVLQAVQLPGPLDEVDCYARSAVLALWPTARLLRRWFYETDVETAESELRAAVARAHRATGGRDVPFTLRAGTAR